MISINTARLSSEIDSKAARASSFLSSLSPIGTWFSLSQLSFRRLTEREREKETNDEEKGKKQSKKEQA